VTDLEPDNTSVSTDAHSSDTDTNESFVFADDDANEGTTIQARRGDSSDEIDPRKLNRDPTLDELRYYYRQTFASTIVDKPIDDAFKNGWDFEGVDEDEGVSPSRAETFVDDANFEESFKIAEKKARRDGFALVYVVFEDDTEPHNSPLDDDVTVTGVSDCNIFTLDNLLDTGDAFVEDEIKEAYGAPGERGFSSWTVRHETGIVINTDPTSAGYRDPIGYVVDDGANGTFVHRDRVIHLTWNREFDGDYRDDGINRTFSQDSLGQWEGDSVLIRSFNLFKGVAKGNWAIMQALYRNAASMYAVHLPESLDDTDDEYTAATQQLQNLNAKSELILPRGPPSAGNDRDAYEVKQFDADNQLEPQEWYDVIFDQICACHEMTKSVLFGTQAGTVSGSDVDIKNYFNKVERYRTSRAEDKLVEFVRRVKVAIDNRTESTYDANITVRWEPLFDLSQEEKVNAFTRLAEGMNTAVNGYLLTPDEARDVLNEDWSASFDSDVLDDLEDLTDEEIDFLDDVNQAQVGRDPDRNEGAGGTSREGNQNRAGEGGMSRGQTTSETDEDDS